MMEGQPSAWMTYVSVDDADATAAAIKKAGGTLFVEPMDVLTWGGWSCPPTRPARPSGSGSPRTTGARASSTSPARSVWNELNTRDMAACSGLLPEVFGWEPETANMGDMEYTEWKLGGTQSAG